MRPTNISIFPLNTVLFPGGYLPLQIFEQRYLSLIKECMTNDHGFVIALISDGDEVNDVPEIYKTGTYAEITDWDQLHNGLLGITIRGLSRVKICNTSAKENGLLTGEINYINDEEATVSIGDEYKFLSDTLVELCSHPSINESYIDIEDDSALNVSFRLSELLPISSTLKQTLLEIELSSDRLKRIKTIIDNLQG